MWVKQPRSQGFSLEGGWGKALGTRLWVKVSVTCVCSGSTESRELVRDSGTLNHANTPKSTALKMPTEI